MRSDTNLTRRFQQEGVDARQYGMMPGVIDTSKKVEGETVLRSHSFSGRESNSVFWNLGGGSFKDISGVTGLDSVADGRGFAFLDFDRDGRKDVVLTNTNQPQLQLFRNEIEEAGRAIWIDLVGGNTGAQATDEWSAREGYGAHVLVKAGGKTLRRELRAGDGFASQNSDVLLIGIGEAVQADEVTVLWPSGKRSTAGAVKAGTLVRIFERGNGEEVIERHPVEIPGRRIEEKRDRLDLPVKKELNVVVTVATWCPVCRGEIEHLRWLKEMVPEVGFYAFPIDDSEEETAIQKFELEIDPPYEIFREEEQRQAVEGLMEKNFGEHPLPSTFILDHEGSVLKVMKGTPTLSDLRLLIR